MTTTDVNATVQQTQLEFGATFADLSVPSSMRDSGQDKLVGGNAMPKSEGGFAEVDARAQHARRETIQRVLGMIHPDAEIDAAAMAIVDDYQNDILSRIVANAAAALADHSPACDLEDEALGKGESEFEIVRKFIVERASVTLADPDYRPEDASMEVPLLVSVDQTATGAEFRALPEGPDAAEIKSSSCLTARKIQTAVRLVLPGELAKYSVDEGNKAVRKFTHNTTKSDSRSRRAGLLFDIESVAARTTKAVPGVLLTEGAAVYLAGVLEYLVAELLELSGNSARKDKSSIMSPRHVMHAIAADDQLHIMCDGAAFYQAGPSVSGTPSHTAKSPAFTPTPAKQAGAESKHTQMPKRAASTAKVIDSATTESSQQTASEATEATEATCGTDSSS